MLKGFKQFVLRGSFVDMAVGVVVGGAFTTVVSALTKDLLTPLLAALVGRRDFSEIKFTVHGSVFALGDFVNAVVSFLLVAAAVYFFVIVPINMMATDGTTQIRKAVASRARDVEHEIQDALSGLDHSDRQVLAYLLGKAGRSDAAPGPTANAGNGHQGHVDGPPR